MRPEDVDPDPWDAPMDLTTSVRLAALRVGVARHVGRQEYRVRNQDTSDVAWVPRSVAIEAEDIVVLFADAVGLTT